ncbi:hypothetical protein TNCV_1744801 [Trichonephila clavipes]|nr:hypothetical protein TNCV_1744801 [Trichonephila clavipes]
MEYPMRCAVPFERGSTTKSPLPIQPNMEGAGFSDSIAGSPVLRPGKDPNNHLSYQPIALTNCLCKTLERMVNARLVHQLGKKRSIPLFHIGFREKVGSLSTISSCWKAKLESFCPEE